MSTRVTRRAPSRWRFGALWVASTADGSVRRIDLGRDLATHTTAVISPTAIAAGAGAIWVASEETGTVSAPEPAIRGQSLSIGVGNGPSAVAVGEGAVWVVNRPDGTVMRIDQETNAVDGIAHVGADPAGVAAGEGGVWVAGGSDGTITRLDPTTARVLSRTAIESSSTAVATADGVVWAAAGAPPASHRGGTLRVLCPSPELPVPDRLARPGRLRWSTWQLISLAYDGLVGYRRVGGAAGSTLVGALATTFPRPAPTARPTSSRSDPGCATRTARRCSPRTSAPRWSASSE